VITFSPECNATTVLWFKERIEKIPGIILQVKSMTLARGTETKPNCYGFLISATYQGYGLFFLFCDMKKLIWNHCYDNFKIMSLKKAFLKDKLLLCLVNIFKNFMNQANLTLFVKVESEAHIWKMSF